MIRLNASYLVILKIDKTGLSFDTKDTMSVQDYDLKEIRDENPEKLTITHNNSNDAFYITIETLKSYYRIHVIDANPASVIDMIRYINKNELENEIFKFIMFKNKISFTDILTIVGDLYHRQSCVDSM